LESFARKRPGGSRALISERILLAINLFSLLNRAVRYTLFLFSTNCLNSSFPGWELMEPPLPHKTSFSCGSWTNVGDIPADPGVTIAPSLSEAIDEGVLMTSDSGIEFLNCCFGVSMVIAVKIDPQHSPRTRYQLRQGN
jgi:hypothetical protein